MNDPGKLYKYLSLKGEKRKWTARIFMHSELYFAAPDQINDPFEFQFNLSFEGTETQRRVWWVRNLQRERPGLSGRDASRMAIDHLRILDQQDPVWRAEAERKVREGVRARLAVLSLSEVRDSTLMWAHYADSHSGICIEFSASSNTPFFANTCRVEYSNAVPVLSHYAHSSNEILRASRLTKDRGWSYEREGRSVEIERGRCAKQFPVEHLTAVILGARISPSDEMLVRGWVTEHVPHARIERAQTSSHVYEIEITAASSRCKPRCGAASTPG
jgi:hypothetical protein